MSGTKRAGKIRRKATSEREEPRWRRMAGIAIFMAAALVAAAFVHLQSSNTTAKDTFYHLRHGALYLERGLFATGFEWLPYSIINEYAGDIWYGYHLLAGLAMWFGGVISQVKALGIFSLALLLVLFYLALRRLEVARSFVWPFVLLSASLWRFAQVRPLIISLGFTGLLFAFAVTGSVWGAFLCSAAVAFFHLSFFWIPILVGLVVTVAKRRSEGVWEWRTPAAIAAGVMMGGMLRPNPFGAAKILYVQIFQLFFEKARGQLMFGRELYAMGSQSLLSDNSLFSVMWLGAMAVALAAALARRVRLTPRQATITWSSLVLSGVFFAMVGLLSRRASDQWALFSVVFIGCVFSFMLNAKREPTTKRRRAREHKAEAAISYRVAMLLKAAGLVLFVLMFVRSNISYAYYMGRADASVSPFRLREAALWLKENSDKGEIVFHANWGSFPELFYWNTHNRYIGGMDPMFQYVYDPGLYWKAHHLLVDKEAAYTWGSANEKPEAPEDTYSVLRRDFGASYLFIEKPETLRLYIYASRDSRFTQVFDRGPVAVFRLAENGAGITTAASGDDTIEE